MSGADMAPHRVEVMGLPVDALSMSETVEQVRAFVREGGVHQHVVLNAGKVVECKRDPALAAVVSNCDLINADGSSIVLAGRVLGRRLPGRVTGIDLMVELLAAAERDGASVYFLGARQEVLDEMVRRLRTRFPALRVAGSHHGYWKSDDEVIEHVRQHGPDYLFLAIPSPRKEFWLNEHPEALGVPFCMGVGGSFDVLAGHVSRAPRPLQSLGLEWTWRLLQEPRRMWRRYLFGNLAFLRLLAAELRQRRGR